MPQQRVVTTPWRRWSSAKVRRLPEPNRTVEMVIVVNFGTEYGESGFVSAASLDLDYQQSLGDTGAGHEVSLGAVLKRSMSACGMAIARRRLLIQILSSPLDGWTVADTWSRRCWTSSRT
jgi:hypothetical protein